MNTFKRKIIPVILLVALIAISVSLCISLSGCGEGTSGLKYMKIEGKNEYACVGGLDEKEWYDSVTVASKYKGCPVTSIKEEAFKDCDRISRIILPPTLKTIESYAFEDCGRLKSIDIPDSVTEIEDRAFAGCGLTDITIPSGVTTIRGGTFAECALLKNVTLKEGVTTIKSFAFHKCYSLANISIPNSVTTIEEFNLCDNIKYNEFGHGCYIGNETNPYLVLMKGEDESTTCEISNQTRFIYYAAFSDNWDLIDLTIPGNVEIIGREAFYFCDITSVIINDGVKIIGDKAFSNSELTDVVLPSSLTSIGKKAFYECAIPEIIFSGTMDQWNSITKGDNWEPMFNFTVICDNGNIEYDE